VADPVSWLLIEPGWRVVAANGSLFGKVVEVRGDEQLDIFDGLAVRPRRFRGVDYLPAEQIATILPGKVTLAVTAPEPAALELDGESPRQTRFKSKTESVARLSSRLRGRH